MGFSDAIKKTQSGGRKIQSKRQKTQSSGQKTQSTTGKLNSEQEDRDAELFAFRSFLIEEYSKVSEREP